MSNKNLKSDYKLLINQLQEQSKLTKIRAEIAKNLFEEADYAIKYMQLKKEYPDMFPEDKQTVVNPSSDNNTESKPEPKITGYEFHSSDKEPDVELDTNNDNN